MYTFRFTSFVCFSEQIILSCIIGDWAYSLEAEMEEKDNS